MDGDWEWVLKIKGGPGSGNFGHAGRPGLVGGSASGTAYDSFFGVREAIAWGSSAFREWTDNLSSKEHDALIMYTNEGYRTINGNLRQGQRAVISNWQNWDATLQIDSALDKARMPKTVKVRRGLCHHDGCVEKFRDLQPGAEFSDDAFVSTSLAESYQHRRRLTVDIIIPEGSKAAYVGLVSPIKEEAEVLLPRASKFVVLDNSTDRRGDQIITVLYQGQSEDRYEL